MPRTEMSLAFNTFAGLRHMLLLGMEDFNGPMCLSLSLHVHNFWCHSGSFVPGRALGAASSGKEHK